MQLKQDLDDNRTGSRLQFKARIKRKEMQSGKCYTRQSPNVSVRGLEVDSTLPEELLDKDCTICITFPGKTSNLVTEDIHGCVVRIGKDSAGLSFNEPLEWFLLFPVYQNKIQFQPQ